MNLRIYADRFSLNSIISKGRTMRRLHSTGLALFFTALLFWSAGCESHSVKGERVNDLKNFGVVEPGKLYRGEEPDESDIAALISQYHVQTFIDLRDRDAGDKPETDEASWVQRHQSGTLIYKRLPAQAQKPDSVLTQYREYTKLLASGDIREPVFVHCHGGRDRTGVFVACYQISHDRLTPKQAYDEMMAYGQNWFVPAPRSFVPKLTKEKILGGNLP
jgi:protein tyrosine/serine phosphatase